MVRLCARNMYVMGSSENGGGTRNDRKLYNCIVAIIQEISFHFIEEAASR